MICLLLTASGARPVVNSRIGSFSRLNGAKSEDPPHEMEGDREILLAFVTFSIWPPSVFAPSKRKPISPFHTRVREDANLPHGKFVLLRHLTIDIACMSCSSFSSSARDPRRRVQ
jgi:hypothetical protein